jgi:hypothetical protein
MTETEACCLASESDSACLVVLKVETRDEVVKISACPNMDTGICWIYRHTLEEVACNTCRGYTNVLSKSVLATSIVLSPSRTNLP